MILTEVEYNGKTIPIEFKRATNPVASKMKKIIVGGILIHYTAGFSTESTVKTFQSDALVSAHFVVGRDGKIIQMFDTDYAAYHAGQSSWRGKSNCNNFLIGIEICNIGLLKKRDGKYYTYLNNWSYEYPKNYATPVLANGQYWEPFTEEALESTAAIAKWAMKTYGITANDFPGHRDVSPGRKIDPGDAFPRVKFTEMISEKEVLVKHNENEISFYDKAMQDSVISDNKMGSGKAPLIGFLSCKKKTGTAS